MEQFPFLRGADAATKRDLDSLEKRMNVRFDRMEDRIRARCQESTGRFEGMSPRFDDVVRPCDPLDDRRFEQTRHEIRSFRVSLMAAMVGYAAILTGAVVAAIRI